MPKKKPESPTSIRVTEYTTWLANSVSSYEALAKVLVKHKAEKGRIVESIVRSALRAILPERFSIGTGFAITASGLSSSQLDLVIYDGLSNSPIILESGTGLFPIECIYGFVEVKSVLDGAELDSVTKAIQTIRSFAKEKRYAVYASQEVGEGKSVVGEVEIASTVPPRSFVFAVNSAYSRMTSVETALKKYTEQNQAHIHALAILETDWFFRQKPFHQPHSFWSVGGQSLAAFCVAVLDSIQSMRIGPAYMKRYLGLID